MARDRKKSPANDRRRVVKRKVSILSSESIDWIDYKDVNLLRRFMSERAKIRARRVTGNSAQQQRAVARAIRIAREMALLPYSVRQVTQRSKGGRRDRDRFDGPPRDRDGEAPRDRDAELPGSEAGAEAGAPPPDSVNGEAPAPEGAPVEDAAPEAAAEAEAPPETTE
jgi:small subunit ribosomal protein S18